MSKWHGSGCFFILGLATSLEEGTFEFKPEAPSFKMTLHRILPIAKGLGKYKNNFASKMHNNLYAFIASPTLPHLHRSSIHLIIRLSKNSQY